VISINNKSTAPITLKDYQDPSNPSQTLTNGNITLAEYLKVAKSISSYMDSNGEAPSYATSSLGNVQYESLVYMYSKIVNYVRVNGRLPNYVSMTPWIANTDTSQTLPTDITQYLQPTANCQSNNAQIITLANNIIKDVTDPIKKASLIYNYVRDKIGYSFYYNTKYGAVGTLNAKTGNCCDTAHLLIALERAAGLPARYVHGYCYFTSSGNWYGHVWAQVYVNGKWYTADAISSRNTFGVIKNWNTATYTLKGIYKELPF
jgi:transglutaminase-like putative cysteine protease